MEKIIFNKKGSVRSNDYDDIDSRELGILDGRYECAESLLEQIKKWENE